MTKRKFALFLAALFFVSTGVAQVPEFNVVPDTVDEDLSAYNEHELEFTFSNQDSEDIHNVTVENTSYLSWSEYSFDLNGSESRTVNATFYSENITDFNETLTTEYGYSGSDNRFSGENISVQVSTFYENTSVNVSELKNSFELEFGESDSSAFTVDNVGSEGAFEIELQGEDISFSRDSGFRVNEGEDALVQFDVSIPKPDENATEATNQTYTRTVSVSGPNFNDTSFEVDVFVPFKQYDAETAEEEFGDRFFEFCQNFPDSTICSDEKFEIENQTTVVNETEVISANISKETEEALQILAQTRSEDYQDILNRVKLQQNTFRSSFNDLEQNTSEKFESVNQDISSLNESTNSNGEKIESLESRIDTLSSNLIFWMMMIFAIAVLIALGKAARWLYENFDDLAEDSRW